MPLGYCSPRRPDETEAEYDERWTAARDQRRQTFLDNYYARKAAGLPSPHSESSPDDDDMAHEVRLVEQDILIDAGLATIDDFANPVEWPRMPPGPPGKSLSEIDPHEPGPYSDIPVPYEEESMFPAYLLARDQVAAEDAGHEVSRRRGNKRGRDEEQPEDEAQAGSSAKKRRTDTPRRRGNKRARDEEQPENEMQAGPSTKKRRTDTHAPPLPPLPAAGAASRSKRRWGPEHGSHWGQAAQPGRKGTPARKRKTAEETAMPPPSSCARLTRARRRQLSGADAQLLQLGKHGQADVQQQQQQQQQQSPDAADDRSKPRPASTKAGNSTTNTGGKARAGGKTGTKTGGKTGGKTGPRTSTRAEAGNTTTTTSTKGRRQLRAR